MGLITNIFLYVFFNYSNLKIAIIKDNNRNNNEIEDNVCRLPVNVLMTYVIESVSICLGLRLSLYCIMMFTQTHGYERVLEWSWFIEYLVDFI